VRPRMLNGFAIRHPAPLVDRSSAPSIPSRLPLSMLGHGRASIRRGMARPRPFRCLFQFRNSFLLSLASGGEERTYTTKHGTTADLKRTVIPLARSFERGRKTGVTAPGEAFAPWHRSRPPSLDRRAVTRHHQTAASPVSRSVQGFKRDDDVRRFRLVKLETSRVHVMRRRDAASPNCRRYRRCRRSIGTTSLGWWRRRRIASSHLKAAPGPRGARPALANAPVPPRAPFAGGLFALPNPGGLQLQ